MPNIAKILKEEIARLSRREIRSTLDRTRKERTRHQSEIAHLKHQMKTLTRQVSTLEKQLVKVARTPAVETPARSSRFVPKGLVSMRKRLGLSAAELANLLGVTAQTIYNWEGGTTKPRTEQQAKLFSLRGVGKRQIRAYINPKVAGSSHAAGDGSTAST